MDKYYLMHAGRLMAMIYQRVALEAEVKMLAADLNDYARNRKIEQDNDQHPTRHV